MTSHRNSEKRLHRFRLLSKRDTLKKVNVALVMALNLGKSAERQSLCFNPELKFYRTCEYDDSIMKNVKKLPVVEQLVAPLGECLTPESARRLLALKFDRKLQARVDQIASRHTEGKLTPDEEADYGRYVFYATFIAILKSKARQLLAEPNAE